MAEVTIDIGAGHALTSVITRKSADALGLRAGDDVTAVIKSTEIMVAK
jgi:molybdate transport system regulatory protein